MRLRLLKNKAVLGLLCILSNTICWIIPDKQRKTVVYRRKGYMILEEKLVNDLATGTWTKPKLSSRRLRWPKRNGRSVLLRNTQEVVMWKNRKHARRSLTETRGGFCRRSKGSRWVSIEQLTVKCTQGDVQLHPQAITRIKKRSEKAVTKLQSILFEAKLNVTSNPSI